MSEVDEIKARLDIVEVISEHVSLQKSGRNFKALCPFHSEKTPSFYVTPERQTWHCFGACGTGGDVLSFLMKKEGMEFQEALRTLAQRAGVQLIERRRAQDDQAAKLYQANDAAASYFHDLLMRSPEAEGARTYLKQRGLTRETVKEFQLGFSPPLNRALIQHLTAQDFKPDEVEAAGLATRLETGELRDLFRGRLMFTIRDEKGRPIGFGARALDDTGPKYINSHQTRIFDKSSVLYGLDRAKGPIRREKWAVVVEGYTDVLTAHQHGYKNVVASMGTALTGRQVEGLKRLATRVSMAMDADAAGQEATLRSLKSSWSALYRTAHAVRGRRGQRYLEGAPQQAIEVVLLPPGKDPDNVIRENEQQWAELLRRPKPLLDYLMEAEVSRANLEAPGARAAILDELRDVLVTADFLDQDRYVQKLARLLNVTEESIKLTLKRVARPEPSRGRRVQKRTAAIEGPKQESRGDALEEYVITLLIQRPDLKELASGLSPEVFRHIENRELFRVCTSNLGMDDIMESLPGGLLYHLEELSSRELRSDSDDELRAGLIECSSRLEERLLKDLKLEETQVLSQKVPGGEEVATIQRKGLERNARLKELYSRRPEVVN